MQGGVIARAAVCNAGLSMAAERIAWLGTVFWPILRRHLLLPGE
jgi:hypothetical protein